MLASMVDADLSSRWICLYRLASASSGIESPVTMARGVAMAAMIVATNEKRIFESDEYVK